MTKEIIVFEKEYCGEGLIDASQDIGECFLEDYNPVIQEIPVDEHGIQTGTFFITVTWKPTE